MRIIHNGRDAFLFACILLHASVHFNICQSCHHIFNRDLVNVGSGYGGQSILYIEKPVHGQPEGLIKAVTFYMEGYLAVVCLDIVAIYVRIPCRAEGDSLMGQSGGFDYPVCIGAVCIDACCFCLLEDGKLGAEVVFKIFMFTWADMVFRDVQEHTHIVCEIVHPVVFKSLAGNLHCHVAEA